MIGFDERDTVFSRMELKPGTTRYQEYYAVQPDEPGVRGLRTVCPALPRAGHRREEALSCETCS